MSIFSSRDYREHLILKLYGIQYSADDYREIGYSYVIQREYTKAHDFFYRH